MHPTLGDGDSVLLIAPISEWHTALVELMEKLGYELHITADVESIISGSPLIALRDLIILDLAVASSKTCKAFVKGLPATTRILYLFDPDSIPPWLGMHRSGPAFLSRNSKVYLVIKRIEELLRVKETLDAVLILSDIEIPIRINAWHLHAGSGSLTFVFGYEDLLPVFQAHRISVERLMCELDIGGDTLVFTTPSLTSDGPIYLYPDYEAHIVTTIISRGSE